MKYLIDKAMDDIKFISQIKGSLPGIKSSHAEAVSRVEELESRLGSTLQEALDLMVQPQNHQSETCEQVA